MNNYEIACFMNKLNFFRTKSIVLLEVMATGNRPMTQITANYFFYFCIKLHTVVNCLSANKRFFHFLQFFSRFTYRRVTSDCNSHVNFIFTLTYWKMLKSTEEIAFTNKKHFGCTSVCYWESNGSHNSSVTESIFFIWIEFCKTLNIVVSIETSGSSL